MDNNIVNVPKIVFIVPYRNRELEKIHFSVYMKYLLEDYLATDYEIYYSHQKDLRPFNRGATKNIGFLALKEKYPDDYKNITFVFNDIDTTPVQKNVLNFETELGKVKHFFGYTYALGGIFSIKGADFEKCEGFPNNWGWGLEDNEMNNKVLQNNLQIDRTTFFPSQNKNIIQLYDNPFRIVNNKEPYKYSKKQLDNINVIKNLEYHIETNNDENNNNEYMINIKNFDTNIDPSTQQFYKQDFTKSNRLKHNIRIVNNRWQMQNIMLR